MKKTLLLGLTIIVILLAGCVSAEENLASNVPLQVYDSGNGYTIDIPEAWVKGEETQTQVEFSDAENSIALTITTELGGVDYFSLKEIMGQLTDEIAAELFSDYEMIEDSGDSATYTRILDGSDENGAHTVAVFYIHQPYQTIRHYLIFVASGRAYTQNATLIKQIIASFAPTMDEDQYLQLMSDRRAATQTAETQDDTQDDKMDDSPFPDEQK